MDDCQRQLVGLVLLSLSLLLSLCLHVIFCIRQRAVWCSDSDECYDPHDHNEESLSQSQVHYFHNLDHHEQQENPIYGNISTDRRESLDVCHEVMQHTRDCMKSAESNLNYAQLDQMRANKHRENHRHQLPVHLTSPVNPRLEVDTDAEAQLPSRDASATDSRSSVYLNSQEISAQEIEGMEGRGASIKRESEWRGERESEESNDYSNGSACAPLSGVDALHRETCHFIRGFSHDGVQQGRAILKRPPEKACPVLCLKMSNPKLHNVKTFPL